VFAYSATAVGGPTVGGMRFRLLHGVLATGVLCLSSPCLADIYYYVDAGGSAHFSNVPADDHYQLLLAAPRSANHSKSGTTEAWLTRASSFDRLIEDAAHAHAVQSALVRALIVVESGFNPRALSKRGAIGLMQLRPETARRYGVRDIYDPAQNIRAGVRYLSDLMTLYDSNTELALAAYNAGEAAVARYGGHIPPYRETQEYVPNVLRVYRLLASQELISRAAD
jgi:soluble lytic murein transglycosylase-like protein